MELNDCAFPTLNRIVATDDAKVAFKDCDVALLVGARPRGPGMERKDLLLANAQIFSAQGKALERSREPQRARAGRRQSGQHQRADRAAQRAGPQSAQFHRDDRASITTARCRSSRRRPARTSRRSASSRSGAITRPTQYPDLHHALVDGKPAMSLVDQKWYEETFIPVVQQRGAAIIKARGASSAASAASAAIDHVRDWVKGTADGDWVSMAVPSDGSYGIPRRRHLRLSGDLHATATTRSCRASRSTSSAASAWTRRTRSCSKSATASKSSSDPLPKRRSRRFSAQLATGVTFASWFTFVGLSDRRVRQQAAGRQRCRVRRRRFMQSAMHVAPCGLMRLRARASVGFSSFPAECLRSRGSTS